MSTCTNCYNGCTEIVSDRCVKYTGNDIPALGISTNDTLATVEQALATFLNDAIIGVGIKPVIEPSILCNLVKSFLPSCTTCTGFDLNQILTALIQSACSLQIQINIINNTLDILNADYVINCLTGVTSSSDTHSVLQATINKVCSLGVDLTTLTNDLHTKYVRYDELDELIQVYLNSTSSGAISAKMVPYAVLPYFGPITFFDASGAGTGNWNRIFLCNGNNGTPDLRGRALTGVINGVPGPTLNPAVDPTVSSANPNYSLYDNAGANQISLLEHQIPLHTHPNTISVVDQGHTHSTFADVKYNSPGANIKTGTPGVAIASSSQPTSVGNANILATITNAAGPVGGGLPHSNIQPVTACYYIQYRP